MVTTGKSLDPRRGAPWAVITLALLLVLAAAACAFPEEAFDGTLDGTYYINGFDHQGTEYGGSMIITPTDDPQVYEMQWIITGAIQTGSGTVSGDQLIAEWAVLEGFNVASHGTAVYQITPEGELLGERMVAGQDGVGTEEALPVR